MSDRDTPLRDAFRATSTASRPRPDCPPAEQIWAAVAGDLEPGEARKLVDHTSGCPTCAEAWRLASELAPASAGASTGSWRRWAALGTAFAVAAALLLYLALRRDREGQPDVPVFRQGDTGDLRSLVDDGARLPRAHAVLRWTPGPAGSRYRLRVADEDLAPVATATDLAGTEYTLTAAQLAAVPAGGRLLWQVEAVTPDGRRLTSASFTVQIE